MKTYIIQTLSGTFETPIKARSMVDAVRLAAKLYEDIPHRVIMPRLPG